MKFAIPQAVIFDTEDIRKVKQDKNDQTGTQSTVAAKEFNKHWKTHLLPD